MSRPYRLLLILCTLSFVALLGVTLNNRVQASAAADQLTPLFYAVLEKVKQDYVEEVDNQALIESALNGMLSSLDPHSSYFNKAEFKELRESITGEFAGIGCEVTSEYGLVKIIAPIDDSPASKAGILAGDYIFSIDNDTVFGLTLTQAVSKLHGKPGSKVSLTLLREGKTEPFTVELTRDIIQSSSVKSRFYNDILYARLTVFTQFSGKQLQEHIAKAKKQNPKLSGLVLDLRNNPGGFLDAAIEVADLFVNEGEIVFEKGRSNDTERHHHATKGDIVMGLPIIVLVNNGTASSPEIVAGALQDHKRAIILGTRTFGKGSVQRVYPIGDGAMNLTVSRYYTPLGRSIQAEGIVPDIQVQQVVVELKPLPNGLRISEASLPNHLSPLKALHAEKKAMDAVEHDMALYQTDFQLARALDLMRALVYTKHAELAP